jgi:hypothetical protein
MQDIQSELKMVAAYLLLMLGIGLLLSFADFLQRKYRFTLKNVLILWTVYNIDWGLRLLIYVLALPLILLTLLLQPFLLLAFLIALGLLLIFGIGLLYEEPIAANPPSSEEALWAALTVVGCLVIWVLASRLFKSEDALYDRYASFFVNRIHQPMEQRAQQLIQKMDA